MSLKGFNKLFSYLKGKIYIIPTLLIRVAQALLKTAVTITHLCQAGGNYLAKNKMLSSGITEINSLHKYKSN